MKGIIDRFEGDWAVIEIEGKTQDFPKSTLDPSVKVGDVVDLQNGVWLPNQIETEERVLRIRELAEELFED